MIGSEKSLAAKSHAVDPTAVHVWLRSDNGPIREKNGEVGRSLQRQIQTSGLSPVDDAAFVAWPVAAKTAKIAQAIDQGL